MIVSLKDGLRLFGVALVSCCLSFVCTLFFSYYADASAFGAVPAELSALYEAQMSMAVMVCVISGCGLGLIAAGVLIFYIKLFLDGHVKELGILKAMGYSDARIALGFRVFGASTFLGSAAGYGLSWACMPYVYAQMDIGLGVEISFHVLPLLLFVVAFPAAVCVLAVLFARLLLCRPVSAMLRGQDLSGHVRVKEMKERKNFMLELMRCNVSRKKSIAFFVACGAWCFSSMMQMGLSMHDLSSDSMGAMILIIGIVLSGAILAMSLSTLVKRCGKDIAVMKSLGYSYHRRTESVFGGYRLYALIGFAVGTLYQWGLLKGMVDLLFRSAYGIEYHFSVPVFFIVLAVFIACYEGFVLFMSRRLDRVSVKAIMAE